MKDRQIKETQDWLLLFKKRMNQDKKKQITQLETLHEEERKRNKTPEREVIDKYVDRVLRGNK